MYRYDPLTIQFQLQPFHHIWHRHRGFHIQKAKSKNVASGAPLRALPACSHGGWLVRSGETLVPMVPGAGVAELGFAAPGQELQNWSGNLESDPKPASGIVCVVASPASEFGASTSDAAVVAGDLPREDVAARVHGSRPWVPSSAENKSVPLTFAKSAGF